MNQKQTDITTGKQIRHLRTQSGMTQEELAGELNVTRQALSNWERDVNEPDLNTLKKICFLFGVHMDDFAKEVITKMETCEKKRKKKSMDDRQRRPSCGLCRTRPKRRCIDNAEICGEKRSRDHQSRN